MSMKKPQSSTAGVAPFINGKSQTSRSDAVVEAVDPSTGCTSYSFAAGDTADVEAAVSSARSSFEGGSWSDAAPSHKKAVLHRFADLVARDAAELDLLDALDMGKPISEAFGNGAVTAGLLRFHAEAADKVEGTVYTSDARSVVIQRRVPRGVVAALAPWNFPTFVAGLKVAPALAAGNSVVLKPSEFSSRSALRFAQLGLEAGLPPGIFNVVPGLGETVGKAMGLHPDIDMLTFTGSTAVGKLMLQYAGQSNMKVVMAECGGKSPHIVFADVSDLDGVAERIARALLTNQGQVCSVGSRLLVERSIERELVEKIADQVRQIHIGAAADPETTFGPIVSARQYGRVTNYINQGIAEGSDLVTGGARALPDSDGYFIEPAIFRNVPSQSRLAQEEIFGPVLAVIPFDDEAEAIAIANGTVYGLIAYIWTSNLSRGMRLMKAIKSSIRINAAPPSGEGSAYSASNEPHGQSGLGAEGGMGGLETYFRRQLVSFSHD